ncbi:MAG: xanthine dehydrogenase family protein, partial [Chloroflexi bacterium]|nr:xanthine dehydrogenase family protein [Chloroflexota bacterium]
MAVHTTRSVQVAGQRVTRSDTPDKVTGRTRYVADLKPRGLLHAALLRCPHAHARIVKLDVSQARTYPGVRAVLTGDDLPSSGPPKSRAHAMLARSRVLFAGQPVAAIAADELAIAEEALDLVEVEYEPLPVVLDPISAMQPDAPSIAEEGTEADTSEAQAHATIAVETSTELKARNVASTTHFSRGDVAAGFAEADVVLERTYHVPMVHQGYIEPHTALADWDATGRLTLWTSTQGQFHTRSETAEVLGLPESRIRVIPMEVGGGFGGKIRPLVEPLAALLSRQAKRPVRLAMTRADELRAGMPAPEMRIRLKTGVTRDGRLTALDAEALYDAGCFPGVVLTLFCVVVGSYYKFPSFEIRATEVLTNKPSIAAYRAPTAPHSTLAIDCQMEEMARAIGADPIEFRLRHASQAGDPMTHGAPWPTIGLKEVIQAATEHDIWKNRPPSGLGKDGLLHGTGLGVGGWLGGLQPAAANVRLDPDGTLAVITGAVDISGTNVAMAQIAAQAYGVPLERVQIATPDTDSAPLAGMSAGSKIIYTVGKAVLEAALDARQQTLSIAAGQLEVSTDDLEIVDDRVQVRGAAERSVTLEQIGRMTAAYGGKVAPILGRGSISQPRQAPGFSAQVAQVAIDPGTGKMVIRRYLCVQDVGYAINPP